MYKVTRVYHQSKRDQYPCSIEPFSLNTQDIEARFVAVSDGTGKSNSPPIIEIILKGTEPLSRKFCEFINCCVDNDLNKGSTTISYGTDAEYYVYNSNLSGAEKIPVPNAFLNYYIPLSIKLDDAANKLLKIAEWHTGNTQNPSVYSQKDTILTIDDYDWKVPVKIEDTFIAGSKIITINDELLAHLQSKYSCQDDLPIYQSMLLESKDGHSKNASFVIAVAALEVATKYTIAKLLPDTSWLLENTPSPPTYMLLKNQIPSALSGRDITPGCIPSELLDEIKKAIHIRNEIVHIGRCSLSRKRRFEFIESIQDVILYLEWFQGDIHSLNRLSFAESRRLSSLMSEEGAVKD